MSDGGGESSSKQCEDGGKRGQRLGGESFARAIAKIAVAQIFEGAGFHLIHELARDTLSDVAVRYICEVGKLGNFYANLAGRSEGNVLDVIQSLEELGMTQGFTDASDLGHCLADSGVVRDIVQYVNEEGENPFVYSIPKFPITRDSKSVPSFAQVGDSPPGEHIPSWLPVLPEPQTYTKERELEDPTKEIEPFREQRDVGSSKMNNLHTHMSSNGSEAPIAVEGGDAAKVKEVVQNNPFLAPPLRFGEKEVAPVEIPPKLLDGTALRELENHDPVYDVISPAAEPTKSPLYAIEELREKDSPSTRPTVQFKLNSFKKSSVKPLGFKIEGSESDNSVSEVNKNKHKRKRRAESITDESSMDVEESASGKIEDSKQVNCLLEVNNEKDEQKERAEQTMKELMDISVEANNDKIDDGEQVNSFLEVNNDKDKRQMRVELIMKEPVDIVEESVNAKIGDSEHMTSLCEVNGNQDERKSIAEQIMKESLDRVEESAEL